MSLQPDLFQRMTWRNIGPPRGGRVVAVAGDPVDKAVFWFGACGGGVWKTDDAGSYWRNVSDGFLHTQAVGALAVSEADPNVVYAGMGESCVRNNVIHGDGVYRTADGGRTWRHLGLDATRHIARVRVSPRDPDLVYVAALGDIFGPNPERGVFRSKDGGSTWDLALHKSEDAGAADLSLDATNPRILYASIWQARRRPWELVSGGPDGGIWRTLDGGDTWHDITRNPGLPEKALLGRVGVAASPARAGRVWALIEAADGEGGVYRSEDAGDSWERVSDDKAVQGRPWYYSHIVPDPLDAETLYSMNFQLWKSSDGGHSFQQITTPHGDNHDLWIDPADNRRMIEGNDGGACVSLNGGESFSTIYNQPTGQFYHVVTDDSFPYRVYGTQQDNSAIRVPSRSRKGVILWNDCDVVGHAESGHIAVSPGNPDKVFSGAVGSAPGGGAPLLKYEHTTGQTQLITIWPEYDTAEDPGRWKHRFNWTYPISFSPHDPQVLYACGERVFRSTDEGQSWDAISPDLTRADPEKMKTSGGPISKDASGAETSCTIFAFAESPHEKGVMWAGSDDGRVHVSRDGGGEWREVTPPELPEWSLVTTIEPSPHDPATVYLCATRYRLQDRKPYLFKSIDYGESWKSIGEDIPEDDFTRVLRADPVRPGLLYCGTETGFYVSLTDGESWTPLHLNLPPAPVYDLQVKGDDLVAATNGRGFWILDDVTALRELPDDLRAAPAVLFSPAVAYRYPTLSGTRRAAPGKNYMLGAAFVEKKHPDGFKEHLFLDAGQNPRDGVTVWYLLADDQNADAMEIEFVDAAGDVLIAFSPQAEAVPGEEKEEEDSEGEERARPDTTMSAEGEEGEGQDVAAERAEPRSGDAEVNKSKKKWWESLPNKAGLNRFTWDLRGKGITPSKRERDKEDPRPDTGWLVAPGHYTVRLRVGSETLEAPIEVRRDPGLAASDDDLRQQYALLVDVRGKADAVNAAVTRARRLKTEIERWANRDDATAEVADAAKKARHSIKAIEKRLTQPKFTHETDRLKLPAGLDVKLSAVPEVIVSADNAPTRQTREVFAKLATEADEVLADLERIVADDVGQLNRLVVSSGLSVIDAS